MTICPRAPQLTWTEDLTQERDGMVLWLAQLGRWEARIIHGDPVLISRSGTVTYRACKAWDWMVLKDEHFFADGEADELDAAQRSAAKCISEALKETL